MVRRFLNNWKTNLMGLVIIFLISIYLKNWITTEQFLTVTAFLTGIGFFFSKDSKKTD